MGFVKNKEYRVRQWNWEIFKTIGFKFCPMEHCLEVFQGGWRHFLFYDKRDFLIQILYCSEDFWFFNRKITITVKVPMTLQSTFNGVLLLSCWIPSINWILLFRMGLLQNLKFLPLTIGTSTVNHVEHQQHFLHFCKMSLWHNHTALSCPTQHGS